MEIKTCEEYVLTKLAEAEETIETLKQDNNLLCEKLDAMAEEVTDEETFHISKCADVFYWYDYVRSYNYDSILEKSTLDLEFLKNCLYDDEKLQEFMKVEGNDYWTKKVGSVITRDYVRKIEFGGKAAVITFGMNELNLYNLNGKDYFLDKDECELVLMEKVRDEIKSYLKKKEVNEE